MLILRPHASSTLICVKGARKRHRVPRRPRRARL